MESCGCIEASKAKAAAARRQTNRLRSRVGWRVLTRRHIYTRRRETMVVGYDPMVLVYPINWGEERNRAGPDILWPNWFGPIWIEGIS